MIIKESNTVNTKVLKSEAKELNTPNKTCPYFGPSGRDILSISLHVLSKNKWRCKCPPQSGSLQLNLQKVIIIRSLCKHPVSLGCSKQSCISGLLLNPCFAFSLVLLFAVKSTEVVISAVSSLRTTAM